MPEIPGLRPEFLLLFVALVLYFTDAAYLLFANEVLFVRGPTGAWSVRYAHRHPEFARRFICLPRPFEPHCAVLRVAWPPSAEEAVTPEAVRTEVDATLDSLKPLQWGSTLLLPQIFLGLPLVFFFEGGIVLLGWILLIYLQAIAMALVLIVKRRALGLGRGKVALIVFESLICIPYAINVYRKTVHALCPKIRDVLVLDRALLGDRAADFRRELAARVDTELQWSTHNDERAARLHRFRQRTGLGSG